MLQEELTKKIIGCAMEVHRTLGAGFLESVYQSALLIELHLAGLDAVAGVRIPVYYRDELAGDFIADILVEKVIIIELKAVQDLHPAHESQLVNYLQATGLNIGLLLNFGSPSLQIKRKHRIYKSPSVHPENPVILSKRAFTILELLVAMTLMSILLVLLLNMVDGATKLWRESESRVDSYREARAALGIMSRDLQNALAGPTNSGQFLLNAPAFAKLSSMGTLATNQGAALFFLAALPSKAQDTASNKSDVCQVGYFLAFGQSSSSSNSPVNTLNIYRYILSSDPTFSRLTNGSTLFPDNLVTTDPRVELLARNITRFTVRAFSLGTNNSLVNFTTNSLPDLLEISISAVNQDASKKLGTTVADFSAWTATNSARYSNIIVPVEQTFTTRIKLTRPQ